MEKKLKIRVSSNKDILAKIQKVLDEVQKKAIVRTMTASKIVDLAIKTGVIIARKFWFLPSTHQNGIIFKFGYENFPNAYLKRGSPEGTIITFEIKRGIIYLIGIAREWCVGNEYKISFTNDLAVSEIKNKLIERINK